MELIEISNGCVIVPKKWIVINYLDAINCKNAYVLESVDLDKNEVEYPHFLYFSTNEKLSFDEEMKLIDFAENEIKRNYGNNEMIHLIVKLPDAGDRLKTYPYGAKAFRY